MRKTVAMLLAGGAGSRLSILALQRAKPAVPFGGIYRIIDFTLSNVMNSGLPYVGVLTQYKPLSLLTHVQSGQAWDFMGRSRGIKILPPRTGEKDSDWYNGTADAIFQNIDYINSHNPERVLILSGDHIYYMNYEEIVNFHRGKAAQATIAMMEAPQEELSHLGIAVIDKNQRIVEWQEKPPKPKSNLASMGIYVFNADFLLETLQSGIGPDFGYNIIPEIIKKARVYAYIFRDYWRDVGTLRAYWEANMDIIRPESGFSPESWGVRANIEEEGRKGDRPPTLISHTGNIKDSVISPGCEIRGEVVRSILSPGVKVEKGARIIDSVVLHDCIISQASCIEEAILDKEVLVGERAKIGVGPSDTPNRETPHHLSCGLTVIGKLAVVPAGYLIGKNCIIHPEVKPQDYPHQEILAGSTIKKK